MEGRSVGRKDMYVYNVWSRTSMADLTSLMCHILSAFLSADRTKS